MFQSSSTWAAAQASSVERWPCAIASAISAEPVSVVIALTAPSRHGSSGNGARGGGERLVRLRDEHHALAQHEARAERVARPGDQRVPMLRLALDQPVRAAGAIADQIGAEELGDLGLHRVGRIGDAVDDGIGEPRERHRRRIDELALRLPFVRQRLRQRLRGRRQRPARRRPHRPAVEQHGVSAGLLGSTETAL